ncbi:DEAD/DEAH box helicase [Lignipirellula cremea]|nr:DEAD/DEAH box helicase [Lignipirellula cremea]
MPEELFHPLIGEWFAERFGVPTAAQREGWPRIAAGLNTLIAAPTGSGKTLAAFLVCLDRLTRDWFEGTLEEGVRVVYVSPLRALSNDIERNLQQPLEEIRQLAIKKGLKPPEIRAGVRTGDTTASQRAAMLRKPPHLLVTTPESLFLLLTSEKGRERLRTVDTVIVDEIHALARDKRGSHLALSLERLTHLCHQPPVRIGLSATQRPIEKIAQFLAGSGRPCEIVDAGHLRDLDLRIEAPDTELEAVCSNEQWGEAYARLAELVTQHHSTLIFVNTRRLAERVAHRLTELLGEDAVASHHGSLAKELRHSAEQRLKDGTLKVIVATASLEMGIDIGYIDLVCQIGSPRSIAAFLQRVGRSGHSLGAVPKGRLFPLTRDQLLECMALNRAVRRMQLDSIEIPEQPLDILAQQIIAAAACEDWTCDDLYAMCQAAAPYASLSRADFDEVLLMCSEGVAQKKGALVYYDRINNLVKGRRGARLAAIMSGGAIPEAADYRVVTEGERVTVGSVDEDFAIDSLAGDVFALGNMSWRIAHVRGGEVVVNDAQGAPPSIPFWFGEAPGRTIELSHEISQLRLDLAAIGTAEETPSPTVIGGSTPAWLEEECGAAEHAALQAITYVQSQRDALGLVPTHKKIVFERFFDESGGMQLVVHAPLGSRINRAWGLALRKRFCRSFDFELQAAADDNGVLLSMGPQHSFAIDRLFTMLTPENARDLLEQAALAAPMFQVRWRWNVTRALAVMRRQGGKKVPPHLQRFRSDDLLSACFPETVGCLENHHGDVEIPSHPLVRQTMHDCLHEAMDLVRWVELLADVQAGRVEFIARDTREPSPFAMELLNANPYAFLDDAPLEERRTRAVASRRGASNESLRDLSALDPAAIEQVVAEAWPVVRDADELHDVLLSLTVLTPQEAEPWQAWAKELASAGRATLATLASGEAFWTAAEQTPVVQAVYPGVQWEPEICLPETLQRELESASEGWLELVRSRVAVAGPITAAGLAKLLHLQPNQTFVALEALEGEGLVLRGRFTAASRQANLPTSDPGIEWCERRLLARIHRLTLEGLRKAIQPASPQAFLHFLCEHHHLLDPGLRGGAASVKESLRQLQGFEAPAGAWEKRLLTARLGDYDPAWLDQLFMGGELVWGRLRRNRRTHDNPLAVGLTRSAPITLLLREDLPRLLPPDRRPLPPVDSSRKKSGGGRPVPVAPETAIGGPPAMEQVSLSAECAGVRLRANATDVLAALDQRGALFFQEISAITGLLAAHLEEALRELAAWGLVTSDGFGAVRSIVAPPRSGRNGGRKFQAASAPMGRWSRFPGMLPTVENDAHIEQWCWQLLARYGVVFRDLLARESTAPAWWELARKYRTLELRGKIRGGRFVAGVGGEQFATEAAVKHLRALREGPTDERWCVISAADPLNLAGVVGHGERVTANHKNALIVQNGEFIAVLQADEQQFFREPPPPVKAAMGKALAMGRRIIDECPTPAARLAWSASPR